MVLSYFNDLLYLRIVGAHTVASLFSAFSGVMAIPGVTMLRTRIASLEQQLQDGEKRLIVPESELLCRLFGTGGRVQAASTSAKALLKRQSAQKQEVASLRGQRISWVSIPSVDTESILVSLRNELVVASDTTSKVRVEVRRGRDQMGYSRRRATYRFLVF